jgi:hypothetical protein
MSLRWKSERDSASVSLDPNLGVGTTCRHSPGRRGHRELLRSGWRTEAGRPVPRLHEESQQHQSGGVDCAYRRHTPAIARARPLRRGLTGWTLGRVCQVPCLFRPVSDGQRAICAISGRQLRRKVATARAERVLPNLVAAVGPDHRGSKEHARQPRSRRQPARARGESSHCGLELLARRQMGCVREGTAAHEMRERLVHRAGERR